MVGGFKYSVAYIIFSWGKTNLHTSGILFTNRNIFNRNTIHTSYLILYVLIIIKFNYNTAFSIYLMINYISIF